MQHSCRTLMGHSDIWKDIFRSPQPSGVGDPHLLSIKARLPPRRDTQWEERSRRRRGVYSIFTPLKGWKAIRMMERASDGMGESVFKGAAAPPKGEERGRLWEGDLWLLFYALVLFNALRFRTCLLVEPQRISPEESFPFSL